MTRNPAKSGSLRILRPTETLRSQVLDTMRAAIVDGTFRPGERLVERKLCDLLGVSRTSVREALRQLEAEGFVECAPYRGPSVTLLTADQVRQIYEMRGALEGLAARLFVERASAEEVAALSAAVETIANAYRGNNGVAQRKAVELFYELLLRGAKNTMLLEAVAAQRARLAWLRAISLSRRERGRTSLAEKRQIVRAIRARNADLARALSEKHVSNALAAVLGLMGDGDDDRIHSAAERRGLAG